MVLTNEVGIQIDKKNWRLADIAMLNNEKISQINNKEKYLEIAPDYIIEIDTKASTEEGGQFIGFDYFQQKTDALLDFGVKKLIWIFTHNQKIMVAEKGKTWFINNWSELPLEIEGKSIFLSDLTKDL
jgi:Uma2 family endonuclease